MTVEFNVLSREICHKMQSLFPFCDSSALAAEQIF